MKNKEYLRASLVTGKPIVLIDLDGVMSAFDKKRDELQAQGFAQEKLWKYPRLFRDLEPISGAVDAWHKLQDKYDTYIVSTPTWSTPEGWSDKVYWVKETLGKSAKKKVILTHNKGLVIGDYLIDDRIANGVADFQGEHIHFGSERFPNWEAVLQYLL